MQGISLILFGILIPIVAETTKVLLRPYKKLMICGDGNGHDTLSPDEIHFTCKPGPGKFVKCKDIYTSIKRPFQCPGYGYVSGWDLVGSDIKVRCCMEPGIKYSHKDCRSHFNKDVTFGRIYRVDKGKVITGFKTYDGGVTWFNYECRYNTSPKLHFVNLY
ncbi:uncharacterized protein LOC134692769 [Mytilus trossulus]|uniref:uncharacterized protein LOC134692769 n=1 Tax=Mytilus trossulus TaxID=6551 RepID=UPI0030078E5B